MAAGSCEVSAPRGRLPILSAAATFLFRRQKRLASHVLLSRPQNRRSRTSSAVLDHVVASDAMWLTVLVLALVATVDPIRVGVSVALSSRPRASRALLAFWLGGVAISIVLAAGVLFGLRDVALTTMHRVQLAAATPTAGHLQIGMGVFALLIAGTAIGFPPSGPSRTGLPDGHSTHRSSAATLSTWSARAQNALQARPIGVAFALGVGMLVDFRFLAALTAILASGAAIGAQVCAAGVYTLVALTFVELPLVSQLAAPAQTDRVMAAVNRWAKARRKQVFAFVLGLLGVFLLTRGFGHA